MALFGKKSGDAGAPTSPKASPAKSGLKFGRKKDAAPPAPDTTGLSLPAEGAGFEDFSDFSDLSSAPNGANGAIKAPVAAHKNAKPRIISGTGVGLNIGNDSIKAIEMQAKGNDIAVTAMGIVRTPAESISNGVVMSVGALEQAIRDLFKQAGIKSKRATISVSGTGALVVRIIEVPKMTDAELAKNMQVDADRYIPFPPSEVIMDFKALRELPSDPDSPNMDVLLAAAQREVIDLHVRVLEEAKLDARAIEVEPLAAARALTQSVTKQAQAMDAGMHGANGHNPNVPSDETDYTRVSAIINIGASGTEISVLRGDILVFTRTIPNGGNALTQALVDYMGLPFTNAEQVKREWADALPPYQAAATVNAPVASNEDWSEFDSLGEPAPAATNAASDDPFDPNYFDQGPTQSEPTPPHAQKEGEADDKASSAFDFSDFSFADEAATPASPAAPVPDANPPAAAPDASLAEASLAFAFPDDEPSTTPSIETVTAPQSTLSEAAAPTSDFSMDAFQFGDEPATTIEAPSSVPLADAPSPAATTPTAESSAPSAWSLDDLGLPSESVAATVAPTAAQPSADLANDFSLDAPVPAAGTEFSAFDLPGQTSVAPSTAVPDVSAPAAGDFDIDSFFGTPGSAPTDATGAGAFGDEGSGGAGLAQASGAGVPDLSFGSLDGDSFGSDLGGFGSGLTDDVNTGVDAATVYSILHPLLEELANEIRRSLEYHASRYPDAVVQSISVVGGGAKLKNIDVFLTQTLGIPTMVGNPLRRLSIRTAKLPESYADENGTIFAVAAGLALRDLVG